MNAKMYKYLEKWEKNKRKTEDLKERRKYRRKEWDEIKFLINWFIIG